VRARVCADAISTILCTLHFLGQRAAAAAAAAAHRFTLHTLLLTTVDDNNKAPRLPTYAPSADTVPLVSR